MREIILDTETTGLDPARGDRIVEIGCIEILNKIPTGQIFHTYLNPQRDMPVEAFRIHGLSSNFLADKHLFKIIAPELLEFLGDSRLVIHNAEFDMRFMNAELRRENLPFLSMERVTDTLALARRKFPGATNSLDALCARFQIDTSRRIKHGALLDAEILAEVYTELCGGRQTSLQLRSQEVPITEVKVRKVTERQVQLAARLSVDEINRHSANVRHVSGTAWQRYDDGNEK